MNATNAPGSLRPYPRWISLLLIVALTGCSTMQAVEVDSVNQEDTLVEGDFLRIVDLQQRVTEMTLIAVEDGALRGTLAESDGVVIVLQLEDIESIEVQKLSPGRSILAGTGGVIVLWGILAAIAISNMDCCSSGN